ncbi:MAG: ferrochelatase, partial [Xanthobacteraceae bacterium]
MPDYPDVSDDPPDELAPSVLPRETEPPPLAPALGEGPEAVPVAGEAAPGAAQIGVLLVNLGTPDAANAAAVRRYLKEYLTDPRVIEKNSLLWRIALNGVILPFRSRRKVRDYRKIWNRERDESPIKTITRSQAEQLANLLKPLGKHIVVDWAMRYAAPSIASRLAAFVERGCDRILVMPLYPQYAAPTTATVGDEVFRFLMTQRRQPALRMMPAYYDDLDYIGALASSLETGLAALPFKPDVIVASYHGMPLEYVQKGDPYQIQCEATTDLLRRHLKLDDQSLTLTYQSRFGRAKWLEPSTIQTVKKLAKDG